MNYYELNDFTSIETNQLILAFKNGTTIRSGCISVFEDSIGKPGDRLVELKKISEDDDNIIFEFENNERIIIKNPTHIVINEKVVGIQNCEKAKWLKNDLSLEYTKDNDLVKTEVIEGEHFFRINQNSSALLFYTW
jgi:hypothetical protein